MRGRSSFLTWVSAAALAVSLPASAAKNLITPEVEARVTEIMNGMSLEQKVAQMIQPEIKSVSPEDVRQYGFGSILNGGGSFPNQNKHSTIQDWVDLADAFYKASIDTSQGSAGIPIMWGIDAVHGHNNVLGATVFPHNLALGAANDADLVYRINKATAVEVAATGIHWTFSPCVTVPQDPRWGRFYEGFGQTTELVNGLTAAAVNGYQALLDDIQNKQVAACAKHFIGDGATKWGTATRLD